MNVRADAFDGVASTQWSLPDSPLQLRIIPGRDRVRIIATGELDLATGGALDEGLRALEQAGFDHIMVDLRGLSCIDCAGLRVVLAANRRARAAHSRFDVIGGGKVGRLLALTGAAYQLTIAAPISGAPFRCGLEVTI